jgi:hypothetical protein
MASNTHHGAPSEVRSRSTTKEEELTAHTGTSHGAIAKGLISFRFSGQFEELRAGIVVDFCIATSELGLLVFYLETDLSDVGIYSSDGCPRLNPCLSFLFRRTCTRIESRRASVSRYACDSTRRVAEISGLVQAHGLGEEDDAIWNSE